MAITVRRLVEIPDLGTWVYAGAAGADREVTWAHVSELPDPTEWFDSGELLMTTGLGIPEEPAEQRAYVERLADAGLSGLMIGDRMHAPELSAELVFAAEERSFPVLLMAYEVPMTAVARAVADANASEQRERLAQTQRIYDTVRLGAGMISGSELLARLGNLVGCELHVLDPNRGYPLLPGSPLLPEELVAALTAVSLERSTPIPALLRLQDDPQPAMALAVPGSRPAAMVALPRSGGDPDLSVLRHVTAVAAFEIEREKAERERRRRLGSELLAGVLDNRAPAESAERLLAERALGEEPRLLVVCGADGGEGGQSDLHLRLEDRGVPHLLLRRAPLLMVLLPDTADALDGLRAEVEAETAIGLSDRLGRVGRIPEAYREARWALEAALVAGESVIRYGQDAAPTPFLPRNLGEAERVVRSVLGPLLDYDAAHDTDLVRSLGVFLSRNRSWKRAAADLHVHNQTLVYRMRRVEELCGRRLDSTDDVAQLWLALRAAWASGFLPPTAITGVG